MKKLLVGMFSVALILGAGTAVLAAGNAGADKAPAFEEMLPFMKKMHPDFSKEELETMYNDCHGANGMMNGTTEFESKPEGMMNRF